MTRTAAIALALALAWAPALADDCGYAFLRVGAKARPASMGEAAVALADDPGVLAYNPGGLALLRHRAGSAGYLNYVAGVQIGSLSFVQPLDAQSTAGASLNYLNSGDIKETTLDDPTGRGLGSFSFSAAALGLGYGRLLGPQLSAGAVLRGIYEKAKEYSSSAIALDLGAVYEIDIDQLARAAFRAQRQRNYGTSLAAGLSVQNLGVATKAFVSDKERLPLTVRAGLAYRPFLDRLTVALAGVKPLDAGFKLQAGAEYWLASVIALRAGYNGQLAGIQNGSSMDDFAGLGGGLGVRYRGYSLDAGYTPFPGLGHPLRVDLTVRF